MNVPANLPPQRTTLAKKQDKDWYVPTYNYYINLAVSLNDKDATKTNIEAANGIVDSKVFNYLVDPLKKLNSNSRIGKLPGEIRNVDFISSIREKNIGEYISLPYRFQVKVESPDAILKRNDELNRGITKIVQQLIINKLNERGVDTGQSTEPTPDPVKFADEFIKNWIDDRAIEGQHILNLIHSLTDFDYKRIQGFQDWWACEEFYTYRKIINNEVYTEVISPLCAFPIDNGSDFVEDMDGMVVRDRISLQQFIDNYRDLIDDSDKEYLDRLASNSLSNDGRIVATPVQLLSRDFKYVGDTSLGDGLAFTDNNCTIERNIICFKSEKEIKILNYINSIGEEIETEVELDYKLDKNNGDVSLSSEWINEVYLGYRFGDDTTGIYIKPKVCEVQRYDEYKKSPKLPFGGKKGMLKGVAINPIPKRLIPFLVLDNIILLHEERAIAKFKDNITIIPKSLLAADEIGTAQEKYFYMLADNTITYDDSNIDLNTITQGFKVVGSPYAEKYLTTLIDLRDRNKREAMEIANMNSERFGDINPNSGKGVLEQSIYRAKLGTLLMIYTYHKALEKDLNAELEFSKVAYANGKYGTYFNKDKVVEVDVNIDSHPYNKYGVFATDSKAEEEKFDLYKSLVAGAASQSGDYEVSSAVIGADSVSEITKIIKDLADAKKEYEKNLQDSQQATIKEVQDKRDATEKAKMQNNLDVAKIKGEYSIQSTIISGENKVTDTENEDINTKDLYKESEMRLKEIETNLNLRKQTHKEHQDNITNKLKKEALQINKDGIKNRGKSK
jgi:hypothetical protein